jgi:hypothetical protein
MLRAREEERERVRREAQQRRREKRQRQAQTSPVPGTVAEGKVHPSRRLVCVLAPASRLHALLPQVRPQALEFKAVDIRPVHELGRPRTKEKDKAASPAFPGRHADASISGSGYSCVACTFLNPPHVARCDVCQTPRPPTPTSAATVTTDELSGDDSEERPVDLNVANPRSKLAHVQVSPVAGYS